MRPHSIFKNFGFWLVVLLLVSFVQQNWSKIDLLIFGRPVEKDLSFNKSSVDQRPVVVSNDEQINIDVFERVHPAVVNIAATTLTMNFWMQVIPQEGQGSGFIIDERGYILTNNHVVAKAQKLTVTLGDGKKVAASLVGRDLSSDLAIIQIPKNMVSAVATLGNSDNVKVGQKAIAIGNPFGLSQTLTTGIISALNREIRGESGDTLAGLIQTDAPINPGNSGGPLLNSNGEVIGINTAIFSLSGGYQGIGFAIPINKAKEVATQLITTGRFAQPWLGISGLALTEDLARVLNVSATEGVLVVEVVQGSPAERAGLLGGNHETIIGNFRVLIGGDIILSLSGRKMTDMNVLIKEIVRHRVGDTIEMEILRDNRMTILKVLLQEKPF